MLKYKYMKIIFSSRIYGSKYLSNTTGRKLLRFEIVKMLIAVLENKFIVLLGATSKQNPVSTATLVLDVSRTQQ